MLRGELGASRSGGNYNLTFERYVSTVADRCPGSQSASHFHISHGKKLWRDRRAFVSDDGIVRNEAVAVTLFRIHIAANLFNGPVLASNQQPVAALN